MKRRLPLLLAIVFLFSSCLKEKISDAVNDKLVKISFSARSVLFADTNSWQPVLGGDAIVQFSYAGSDSVNLSSKEDSLDLKNIGTYTYPLVVGKYNVFLGTRSTALADTFIRFTAMVKDIQIDQDQLIVLPATSTDGMITISKATVDTTITPTFTPAAANLPIDFAHDAEYYYLYVAGTTTGTITFTDSITGSTYIKEITVSAQNQYDIFTSFGLKPRITVHSHPIRLTK